VEWQENNSASLNDREQEFLKRSTDCEKEEKERELKDAQQRAEEAEVAAARLRQRAWLLAVFAVVAAVFAGVSILFYWRANTQQEVTLARQLAAQARSIVSRDVESLQRKVLLAVTSLQIFHTSEAAQVMYEDGGTLPLWGTSITHQSLVWDVV